MKESQTQAVNGEAAPVSIFDAEEAAIYEDVVRFHGMNPDWVDFCNFWSPKVLGLYDKRGMKRAETIKSPLYRAAQKLGSRLAVAQGIARVGDSYRDELGRLIRNQFRTRRAFCQATGISEDMLSHVLAGRKHLAIDTLEEALKKIGYRLTIEPVHEAERTAT